SGPKRDDSDGFDARREADSLLSGLHGDDAFSRHREEPSNGASIPRQRSRQDGYERPWDAGEYPSRRRAHAEPDTSSGSSAWRSDARTTDGYRPRAAQGGVTNGWSDEGDPESRAASWSMESPRRGRHYEPQETRAISRQEAEAMPRWSEYESPSRSRSASYMDEYYGGR